MILFASDIDNTLIYSYKRELSGEKVPCEEYQGRTISYMTIHTYKSLDIIYNNALFVPVTTRSMEQYNRIRFGEWIPKYAITSNGGNLLINGKVCDKWHKYYQSEIKEAVHGMDKGAEYLKNHKYTDFDVRRVDDLFVFTKNSQPEETAEELRNLLYDEPVTIHTNGIKVYVVPKKLNKGSAVKKFISEYENIEKVITAGDSDFDIPLLNSGDIAVYPDELEYTPQKESVKACYSRLFSEIVVDTVREKLGM